MGGPGPSRPLIPLCTKLPWGKTLFPRPPPLRGRQLGYEPPPGPPTTKNTLHPIGTSPIMTLNCGTRRIVPCALSASPSRRNEVRTRRDIECRARDPPISSSNFSIDVALSSQNIGFSGMARSGNCSTSTSSPTESVFATVPFSISIPTPAAFVPRRQRPGCVRPLNCDRRSPPPGTPRLSNFPIKTETTEPGGPLHLFVVG